MFGMSAPSVRIADPFQESGLGAERGAKSYEPQFTRIGHSPDLEPSTNGFRSAVGTLGAMYHRVDSRITERLRELPDMGKIDVGDEGGLAIICVTRLET